MLRYALGVEYIGTSYKGWQKQKKTKQIRKIKEGKEFVKPSAKKRAKKLKAVYIQKLRDEEQKSS